MDKTYVFDNGGSGFGSDGMAGLVASLCNKQGIDPGYLAAMMNNNGGFGGNGSWAWIVILLIFGWGGFGGNGFGGRGNAQGLADLGNLVNNDAGRELLMQAIQGNGNAISQLASTAHCDVNALQASLQNLSTQICNLGGQVGLGQKDIVAAITNGNQSILSKLCDCCCSTQRQISDFRGDIALQMCQQTGTLSNGQRDITAAVTQGFCDSAYATREQTGQILNAIEAQSRMLNDKFCQLEMREMQQKIDALREHNSQLALAASQAAQTQAIVNQLQPVAKPCYLTCSPYQAYGYPYGGYPYALNNGCGCNQGCGCNNGCGC